MNQHLVLISGKSATGKSLSLRNIPKPEGVMYLNCENGKSLPFNSKFKEFVITDPFQIYEAFTKAEEMPEIHTIIVDSLTFMMDMFESVHVVGSFNTKGSCIFPDLKFKNLMNQYVAKSTKNVIFTAHTMDVMNEAEMVNETLIKVKGSLMNVGIEAMFTTVISTKKVPLKKLEGCASDLLNVTEEEELLGFKYVYQTKLTKETVNERIRSSIGMWDTKESFIDNDVAIVLQRLHEYYK